MRILISGFEPFGGLSSNPTLELIERAKDFEMEGIEIFTIVLPVIYNQCVPPLLTEMERIEPDVVVCLGVAVGRSSINLERVGINIQDTAGEGKQGDNSGDRPVDREIVDEGPDGLFSTLPLRSILEALQSNNIPSTISNTAGTYICNTTMYSILYEINRLSLTTKAGFIHVPATPDMVVNSPKIPSMDIQTQTEALRLIVEELGKRYI
ncbi:peptidase C15 [Salipaludibacillus keqinensis]|uniref:Pyroglutamyl-peptidase I n=1 Tax=Salipaludibacillus keqinensis TaxID=2045207 RepID=A0A323TLW4_9BACI|nr:pyroglutamyl-peptidase I [Salipaludibacillus keqinensis]PYZ93583.1 peptidase C15 [Salipaludibacillus keqinensis]